MALCRSPQHRAKASPARSRYGSAQGLGSRRCYCLLRRSGCTAGPKIWTTVLAEAAKHGFGRRGHSGRVREGCKPAYSASPAGNAMGVAPDWAVWLNRHVMIAFTTMMWMAEDLELRHRADGRILRGQSEVGARNPQLHPSGRTTGHRQAKRTRQTLRRPPRVAQCLFRREMGRRYQSISVGLFRFTRISRRYCRGRASRRQRAGRKFRRRRNSV